MVERKGLPADYVAHLGVNWAIPKRTKENAPTDLASTFAFWQPISSGRESAPAAAEVAETSPDSS